MKKTKFFGLLLFAAAVLSVSCNKDKQRDSQPETFHYTFEGMDVPIADASYFLTGNQQTISLNLNFDKIVYNEEGTKISVFTEVQLAVHINNLGKTIALTESENYDNYWKIQYRRLAAGSYQNPNIIDPESTMKISRNGDYFAAEFNIVFTDGKKLTGKYRGPATPLDLAKIKEEQFNRQ